METRTSDVSASNAVRHASGDVFKERARLLGVDDEGRRRSRHVWKVVLCGRPRHPVIGVLDAAHPLPLAQTLVLRTAMATCLSHVWF